MSLSTRRFAGAAVLTALALVATGCGGGDGAAPPAADPSPSVSEAPEETGIVVDGLAPDEIEVTEQPGTAPGESLSFGSPVYTVTSSSPLTEPTTVELELTNAIPAGIPLYVATRATADRPWSYLPARLGEDPKYVEFTTSALGDFGAVLMEPSGAIQAFRADVRRLTGAQLKDGLAEVACDNFDAAVEDGYGVRSKARPPSPLSWCLDREGDQRVLRVLNRRTVPIFVVNRTAPAIGDVPAAPKAWAAWSRVLGDELVYTSTTQPATFLAPGRGVVYDVDLEPATRVRLDVASDQRTVSLRVLQASVQAAAARLRAFGVGPVDAMKSLQSLLDRPQCARTLGQGSAAMLKGCLSRRKLVQTFGSRANLLVPVLPAAPTAAFLETQFARVAKDQGRNTNQSIIVTRTKPDFSAFVGTFVGQDRSLTVNAEGLVFESARNGLDRVADVTYQLSEPVDDDQRTAADAVITKVKVFDRKAFRGRVPQVGDTGRFRLDDGVVRSPFVGRLYCDAKPARKGVCGDLKAKPAGKPAGKPGR